MSIPIRNTGFVVVEYGDCVVLYNIIKLTYRFSPIASLYPPPTRKDSTLILEFLV